LQRALSHPVADRMSEAGPKPRSPWAWIPTLYLAEGLPYVLVMTLSSYLYKGLGVSNAAITFYTGLLYLPWVIKPLWSPVVDLLGTRRRWIWVTQLVVAASVGGLVLAIPGPHFFRWTLVFFWLLAFDSATHDIAADGFYMLGMTEREQSLFVGVRSMFYRLAMITGEGLLVMLAGAILDRTGDPRLAWSVALGVLAAAFLLFGLWHRLVLPRPASDRQGEARDAPRFVREFLGTFGSFFRKPRIVALLLFLLLYRLGEAQLVKMTPLFLLDARSAGGLGLATGQVGFIKGAVGVVALVAGGLLGGWVVSRHGLKAWLWPMLLAIHLPDAAFLYLAHAQPTSLLVVQACVAVEQFGYGFGFTAYLLYMIRIARGEHATAHYAICTGFMALGMMLPGMWSGWLADLVGYRHFFAWVILATVPSFVVAMFIPLERDFGRKGAA
jgi:MFS transporter, PAT family, beta-lactamase induction signal transducer AmpG